MILATWRADPDIAARYIRAVDAGLVAAADVFLGAIRERLRQGFTTGAFVTGALADAVTRSGVMVDGDARYVVVGVPGGEGFDYALYWELGHMNLFSRRYERVEVWRSVLNEQWAAMGDAFRVAFIAAMDGVDVGESPSIDGSLFSDRTR